MERSIYFNSEMINAILSGKKTQVRKPVVPQPDTKKFKYCRARQVGPWFHIEADEPETVMHTVKCKPFGEIGDILWVKETWAEVFSIGKNKVSVLTPTGKGTQDALRKILFKATNKVPQNTALRWRSAVHMPRWASRIELKVTNIRCQRLHDIGKDGCKAKDILEEGIEPYRIEHNAEWFHKDDAPALTFFQDWNKCYPKFLSNLNPWVWACTFERIK